MSNHSRNTYSGPAILSYGFRPFFLLSIVFAVLVIPLWMAIYLGQINLASPFAPVDWHIHEMLFGYTAAVLAGFLFTAIPNWTGRMPINGWPLGVLVTLWLAGRMALAGVGELNPYLVMGVDCSFLLAVSIMIAIEIIAGRNWRNLKVVIPVLLFLTANILFHIEVIVQGSGDYGRRMGFAVVVFLITLIGGRIIPSFTRNWLVQSNPGPLPATFGRFDAICLMIGAGALVSWIAFPHMHISSALLIIGAALHLVRLSRWCGIRTIHSPLLLILHIAYGFIPLGFFIVALGAQTAGLHLLGIGAIGGMTAAVMIRATLGHTGRALHVKPDLVAAFAFLVTAALMRSFTSFGLFGLVAAAGFWAVGFGIVLFRVGPWLWATNKKRRAPNKRI